MKFVLEIQEMIVALENEIRQELMKGEDANMTLVSNKMQEVEYLIELKVRRRLEK